MPVRCIAKMINSDGKYSISQDIIAAFIGDCHDMVSDGLLNASEPFAWYFSYSLLSQGSAGSGKCHFHYQGKEPLPM